MQDYPGSHSRLRLAQFAAIAVSLLVSVAVVAFAAGLLFERNLVREVANPQALEVGSLTTDSPGVLTSPGLSRLDEVTTLIEQEYYLRPDSSEDAEEFWRALEESAIRGLTAGLDGHTTYLPPTDSAKAADSLSGSYEGIGIWINSGDGAITVVAPVPGSPAENAGIRSGDVIVAIDGRRTVGMDEKSAVEALMGPAGEEVELSVQRTGGSGELTFSVVRQRITYPVVKYQFEADREVAIITVMIFGDRTVSELDTALARARQDGAKGIVLDLRNNGGGWVQSAQETIGRFLDPAVGPALYEDFNGLIDGDEVAEPIIAGDFIDEETPLVVLVNGGSASASEIVAGALSDYGRALIVGMPTYGKGSVQRVHEFSDGASLRLTFAQWLTPNLHTIENEGLQPDLVVEPIDDESGVDVQLESAINKVVNIE
ncbi:hypothetical protein BH23CHL5_BH23CHL5_16600 [soil metagenome]